MGQRHPERCSELFLYLDIMHISHMGAVRGGGMMRTSAGAFPCSLRLGGGGQGYGCLAQAYDGPKIDSLSYPGYRP